jgi:hydrogenase maturation factor
MAVQGQTEQKVHEIPTSTNKKMGVVVCTGHTSYARNINKRIIAQAGQGINARP